MFSNLKLIDTLEEKKNLLEKLGIDNLIINSTSVFPTGGIANPTLTMLALTSRLAERLNNE